MDKKQARRALLTAALGLIAVCLALVGITYAWFTFDPYTRVTPMEGKISEGSANLLISESREGPFEKECQLHPASLPETLYPVSTANLTTFFTAARQNRDGITTHFKDVTAEAGASLISGTVYLQCRGGSCTVYFQAPPLDLGTDGQWLASGRLGLRITGGSGRITTLIFKLDALGSTAGAQLKKTITADNAVVAGLSGGGSPNYSADPAQSIGDYLYDAASPKPLCQLAMDEIARVDYWVYLEGCDTACYNPVQARELALQLGFSGKAKE